MNFSIEDLNDDEFLDEIGTKIGNGYQADIYEFGDDAYDLVVKVWRKSSNLKDILNEFNIAKLAGDHGCGPIIFDFRDIDGLFYMVMEEVIPTKLKQTNYKEVVTLFRKLIKLKIVNYDGSFARTNDGNLVLLDYGVSKIANSSIEASQAYCDEDYFWGFPEYFGVNGLYDYFCKSKSPKSPSPKISRRR